MRWLVLAAAELQYWHELVDPTLHPRRKLLRKDGGVVEVRDT